MDQESLLTENQQLKDKIEVITQENEDLRSAKTMYHEALRYKEMRWQKKYGVATKLIKTLLDHLGQKHGNNHFTTTNTTAGPSTNLTSIQLFATALEEEAEETQLPMATSHSENNHLSPPPPPPQSNPDESVTMVHFPAEDPQSLLSLMEVTVEFENYLKNDRENLNSTKLEGGGTGGVGKGPKLRSRQPMQPSSGPPRVNAMAGQVGKPTLSIPYTKEVCRLDDTRVEEWLNLLKELGWTQSVKSMGSTPSECLSYGGYVRYYCPQIKKDKEVGYLVHGCTQHPGGYQECGFKIFRPKGAGQNGPFSVCVAPTSDAPSQCRTQVLDQLKERFGV